MTLRPSPQTGDSRHEESDLPRAPGVTLSVIIVSWNTRDLLADCLRSLCQGGMDGIEAAERWVVDNASSDGSAAMVREHYPDVHLLPLAENVGFARASNRVLRQASGCYVLLLNPDTVVPPGALAALVSALEADSTAAVASPLLLNADGTPQWCWARFPGVVSEATGKLDLRQSPYPLTDFAEPSTRVTLAPFPVDWVGGACFMVRTGAVRQVGLLDEGFFMYAEETDWCRRFRDAGWTTLLVPAVTVTHRGGESAAQVPEKTRARMYRSSLRFYRKAYGPLGALLPSLLATIRYGFARLREAGAK